MVSYKLVNINVYGYKIYIKKLVAILYIVYIYIWEKNKYIYYFGLNS